MEPSRENAAVVLKKALNDVIMPARGTWNAKLESVALALVMSIVEPNSVSPWALLPKPTKAGSPARPPATVVSEIGSPDANGIIAPVPATPVGPVAPVEPVAPVAPVAPLHPCGPLGPTAPVTPLGPVAPCGPIVSIAPVAPFFPLFTLPHCSIVCNFSIIIGR